MHSTRRAILEYIRAQGNASVEDLALATGLAPVTVRHHLGLLRAQDLVEYSTHPEGRGRPRHVFHLTHRGAAVMSGNPFESLLGRLLDAVKDEDGATARALFQRLGQDIAQTHREALVELAPDERVEAVVGLLSDEGLVVRWQALDDGSYRLEELACPFEGLGSKHHEVCCLDLHLIQVALDAEVEREQWRVAGDATCAFRVRLRDADAAAALAEGL